MRNAIVLMSGGLALALLATGLIILPNSVQYAEANPCLGEAADALDINCDFYGPVTIYVQQPTNEFPLVELPHPLPTE
jgi:hypothetical protein